MNRYEIKVKILFM